MRSGGVLSVRWQRDLKLAGRFTEIGYKDSVTGLSCRMELREIRDFPAVEWVVHFSNEGTNALPVLTDVDALQLSWKCSGDAFVYRAPGGKETPLDFQFQREPLQTIRRQGLSLAMNAGSEGRSSVDWLPFFNLQSGNDGLIVAIGWTGQWFATVGRSGDVAHLRAGMEGLRVSLRPGKRSGRHVSCCSIGEVKRSTGRTCYVAYC